MRIISGQFKGRKMVDSSHLRTVRPTTDKNRQALFNILTSAKFLEEIDFSLEGAVMLDLCCGTGAVGFEALSRGVKNVLFVDQNMQHLEIAKKNAELFKVEKQTKFVLADALNLRSEGVVYNFVYIDPPYRIKAKPFVENLLKREMVDKNSLIVIESGEGEFDEDGLRTLDLRRYGESFFRFCVVV